MSHPRSSLRALAAALALATLVPLSLAPAVAEACVHDMYVDEPLLVLGTWPAQDEVTFPTDGVIRVQIARIGRAARIETVLGAHVTDLDTDTEERLDREVLRGAEDTEVVFTPQAPWRAGGRYRLVLTNLDNDTVVTEVTWQVGPAPAPALAFAPQADAWCLDQVEVGGACIGGWHSCDGCMEFAASTVETQARLTLSLPDPEVLAQTGRKVVQVSAQGAPAVLPATDTHRIWWGAGSDPTCIDVQILQRGGATDAQRQVCPPSTLAGCAELTFTGESPPNGNLDAGLPGTDGGGGTPSAQPVEEQSGCQASPGVDRVPLAAGLFALLLGLGRRRRAA